jgi:hypothetical protein
VLAAVLVLASAPAVADDAVRLFSPGDLETEAEVGPIAAKIRKEIALAQAGKARLLVVSAGSTDNWGCECPPFVYGPFANSAADESVSYFYPIGKGGPDPAAFPIGAGGGLYELTGRFTKDRLDYDGWLDRRKVKHKPGRAGSLAAKQPVFAVDRWCFRASEQASDGPYADVLARMKKAGVAMCK